MNGMTNDECGMTNGPARTALKTGNYGVTVTSPEGCVMSSVMIMSDRQMTSLLLDDAYLVETLVALTVASAAVIAEMERGRQ